MDDHIVLRAYGGYKTSTKHRAGQTFAAWCANNAAACIVPLALDPEIVAWIVGVMQSSGAMQGIENITTLERNLKLRRTKLRFATEIEWEKVTLTARVLFRIFEEGSVR